MRIMMMQTSRVDPMRHRASFRPMTLRRVIVPLVAAAAGMLATFATPALATPTRTCVPGDHADCRGVDLRYRDLLGLSLRKADLRDARLHFANLSGASLTDSILPGMDLSGINFSNTYLDGAQMANVNLSGVSRRACRRTRRGSVIPRSVPHSEEFPHVA